MTDLRRKGYDSVTKHLPSTMDLLLPRALPGAKLTATECILSRRLVSSPRLLRLDPPSATHPLMMGKNDPNRFAGRPRGVLFLHLKVTKTCGFAV
jgi:hypothetical protein